LTWVFIQSCALMVGGFIGPVIRKITPRAALLGTLASVSISFISMRPALEMFMTPVIGIVCFAIILLSWFGGVQYYRGMPAGLVAIAIGSLIAWSSSALGFNLRWYESRQPRTLGLELRLLIPTSGRRPRGLWR
jgi:adenine/guanine/hypoxanthine permease